MVSSSHQLLDHAAHESELAEITSTLLTVIKEAGKRAGDHFKLGTRDSLEAVHKEGERAVSQLKDSLTRYHQGLIKLRDTQRNVSEALEGRSGEVAALKQAWEKKKEKYAQATLRLASIRKQEDKAKGQLEVTQAQLEDLSSQRDKIISLEQQLARSTSH
ncbi:MAG: hypothetical protein LQ352_001917 [Teloschistes flavicans]|nr:MAG: hypothetical protein LQ352_001917 [Teloschistes flavicans]